jgi:hypothetical protein
MKLVPILPTQHERARLAERMRRLAGRMVKTRGGYAHYGSVRKATVTLHLAALVEHCDHHFDSLDIGHEPGVRATNPSRFNGSLVGSNAAACAES